VDDVIFWENDVEVIKNTGKAIIPNEELYFKECISWNRIAGNVLAFRHHQEGILCGDASPFIYSENKLIELLGYINSKLGIHFLNYINPTLAVQTGSISKIPFINNSNFNSDHIVKNCIELSKKDWDSRETSWDFEKSPLLNQSQSLKFGYVQWKADVTKDFFQLHYNEEELNRIFTKIYELQDEITPEVSLKDMTILQDELKKNDLEALEDEFRAKGKDAIELPIIRAEVISQFISYAIGLFMGRYRLDKPGLNIAHPNPSKEELSSYTYNHGEVIIDQDAILPLMGKQCNFSDDVVKQFNQLIDTIWGHEQRTENINFIQECLNKEIDKFLVNDFWSYHCSMYKKTPIYWLFSSKKGAFQVLVYMHRMNEFTVEKIRANYLLEHLKYLKSEIAQKEANVSNLSTAEARQLDKLRIDLAECEQYDLALKNVADQQIKFDLDNGVANNYELFETVVAKIK
jgi:hypothetical protein